MGKNDGLAEGTRKTSYLRLCALVTRKKDYLDGTIRRGCTVSRVLLAFELLQSLERTAIIVLAL